MGAAQTLAAKQPNLCQPASDQVVVRFTYGSEKAAWIYEATEAFNRKGFKTASAVPPSASEMPTQGTAFGGALWSETSDLSRAGYCQAGAQSPG
ncbi:MAG: hypothetical protein C1943_11100 [Halochromatium sp.]|nr:hypothetical protein [Halochromatium sp.]